MPEVLSEQEIDNLLLAISAGEADMPDDSPETKIQIYDFNRPARFVENQLISIKNLHTSFTKGIESVLSSLFDGRFAFFISSVDELTYEEFIRSIPHPTLLCEIKLVPFPYCIVLEIDPALTCSMINLLTGGSGQQQERKIITELDLLLIKKLLTGFVTSIKEMWQDRISLNPVINKIESNPGSVTIVSPDTMTLLVTIESHIEGAEGMINICYPSDFIIVLDEIEKQKSKNENIDFSRNTLKTIRFQQYHQFSLKDYTFQDLIKCKGKTEITIPGENTSKQKFTPVLNKGEVTDVR